jgi:hypothetical protein
MALTQHCKFETPKKRQKSAKTFAERVIYKNRQHLTRSLIKFSLKNALYQKSKMTSVERVN